MKKLNELLKHHVTGAIERGEAVAIEAVVAPEHTPGPWQIYPPFTNKDGVTVRASLEVGVIDADYSYGYKAVAQIFPVNLDKEGTDQANASLIAAAPELLFACEEALKFFKDNNFHSGICEATGARLPTNQEIELEDAIKKAKGGVE